MITFGQIIGTQSFGFCFMGLMIGSSVWAVIWEIFFKDEHPKIDTRPGEPY